MLARFLIGSLEPLSRLLDRISSGGFAQQQAQEQTLSLLSFAYRHKIYTLLPCVYYLILSVYDPTQLAGTSSIPAVDRIRCLSAFPTLFNRVNGGSQPLDGPYRKCAFWKFASFTRDLQKAIWNDLPGLFQLGTWDELKQGVISTTVS